MDRWRQARWWIRAGLYGAAAPSFPAAAWLLYDQQGPNPVSLTITVAAGAASVPCVLAGLAAARTARVPDPVRPGAHRHR